MNKNRLLAGRGAGLQVHQREEDMTDIKTPAKGISRRQLIRKGALFTGAGLAAGLTGFPYINRMAVRAQSAPLKFWQFYAPGGQVKSQVDWFTQMITAWN